MLVDDCLLGQRKHMQAIVRKIHAMARRYGHREISDTLRRNEHIVEKERTVVLLLSCNECAEHFTKFSVGTASIREMAASEWMHIQGAQLVNAKQQAMTGKRKKHNHQQQRQQEVRHRRRKAGMSRTTVVEN